MKNILLVLFAILLPNIGLSSEPSTKHAAQPLTTWTPSFTWLNINNISTQFQNDGWCDRNSLRGSRGMEFPKGSGRTIVFQSGMLWALRIADSLHVGGSTYISSMQPGKILSPGVAEDPNLPKNRIYRVRPDYATSDLSSEVRDEGRSAAEIRAQYAIDWNQWPAADGAPFDDRNGNGTYEQGVDIPGKKGADQTIWYVCNDLDTARSRAFFGTKPAGMEMQVTVWGYDRNGAFGNVLFRNYRFINKSTNRYDSVYIGQWADVDLGDGGDDFGGCDIASGLQYCYNGQPMDREYSPLPPPAVGFQFITTPMYASVTKGTGSAISDPPFGRYDGAVQWYNWIRGLLPIDGGPFIHPSFPNQPTRYWMDGDPVTRTGRLDGVLSAPSDRRIHASVGPLRIFPGETFDLPIAVLAAFGSRNVTAITSLRDLVGVASTSFASLSRAVPPKAYATVTFPIQTQAAIQLNIDLRGTRTRAATGRIASPDGYSASLALYDDGAHGDGGANDQIWGNRFSAPQRYKGMYASAALIDSSNAGFYWERIVENISTSGPLSIVQPRVFSDNINSDGVVNPRENIRFGFSLWNRGSIPLRTLFLSSKTSPAKFIQFAGVDSGRVDSMRYNPLDSLSYFSFDAPDSGVVTIPFAMSDTNANVWHDTVRFTVVPLAQPIRHPIISHVAGISEWEFDARVVNSSAVQNHLYEITLADSIFAGTDTTEPLWTKVVNLRDATTGDTLLRRHPLPDEFGHNMPVISGFKVVRGGYFGHLGMRRDSTRWIPDGQAWLKGDGRFSSDPQSAFDGAILIGFPLSFYLGAVQSSFSPFNSYPVEIRCDVAHPQKAYRLRRVGTYLIQDYVNVPFSAWDVSNRSAPRQITVSWRDQNGSGTWDPLGSNNLEIVFIYNRSYDPTGTTQFSMPPNAIPNEATSGPSADIMYGLSLYVKEGHVMNESPGTLYLRPTLAPSDHDRFTFNPTIVLGVGAGQEPTAFELYQNYPNPFNPSTTIRYQLASQSKVTIKIFNLLGQEIKTLVNDVESAGMHELRWDGRNRTGLTVATGVYFYRIETNGSGSQANALTQVKKMMLLR